MRIIFFTVLIIVGCLLIRDYYVFKNEDYNYSSYEQKSFQLRQSLDRCVNKIKKLDSKKYTLSTKNNEYFLVYKGDVHK